MIGIWTDSSWLLVRDRNLISVDIQNAVMAKRSDIISTYLTNVQVYIYSVKC